MKAWSPLKTPLFTFTIIQVTQSPRHSIFGMFPLTQLLIFISSTLHSGENVMVAWNDLLTGPYNGDGPTGKFFLLGRITTDGAM